MENMENETNEPYTDSTYAQIALMFFVVMIIGAVILTIFVPGEKHKEGGGFQDNTRFPQSVKSCKCDKD